MKFEYLTYEQLEQLNIQIINEHSPKEIKGVKDSNLLHSALYQPQASFFGEDLSPTIEDKVTVLTFSLVKNHAFHNANKRVAFAAALIFLNMNGFELPKDAVIRFEDVIANVGSSEMTKEQLFDFFKENIKPR